MSRAVQLTLGFPAAATLAALHFAAAAAASNAGDPRIAFGEYLASECVTCHQLSGASNGIPAIVGWEPPRFVSALGEYRKKARSNPTMQAIASRLEDEEIEALAAYFAIQKSAH